MVSIVMYEGDQMIIKVGDLDPGRAIQKFVERGRKKYGICEILSMGTERALVPAGLRTEDRGEMQNPLQQSDLPGPNGEPVREALPIPEV